MIFFLQQWSFFNQTTVEFKFSSKFIWWKNGGGRWGRGKMVWEEKDLVLRDYHKCVFPLLSKGKKSTFPWCTNLTLFHVKCHLMIGPQVYGYVNFSIKRISNPRRLISRQRYLLFLCLSKAGWKFVCFARKNKIMILIQ
jgi:hypothetical protein